MPDGESECAPGMCQSSEGGTGGPQDLQQIAHEMLRRASNMKLVEIDWSKVNTFEELKEIVSCAIPCVVRNSPQYFRILKYLKQ